MDKSSIVNNPLSLYQNTWTLVTLD